MDVDEFAQIPLGCWQHDDFCMHLRGLEGGSKIQARSSLQRGGKSPQLDVQSGYQGRFASQTTFGTPCTNFFLLWLPSQVVGDVVLAA